VKKISANEAQIAELKKTDESHTGEIHHLHKKNIEEPEKEMTIKPEPSTEVEIYWIPCTKSSGCFDTGSHFKVCCPVHQSNAWIVCSSNDRCEKGKPA